jgi:hypothetical protein
MKAAAAAVDNTIAKRFLLPIQRDGVLAKMGQDWDEAMKLDWHPGKRGGAAE